MRKGEDKGIQGCRRKVCKESDRVEDIAINSKLILKWIWGILDSCGLDPSGPGKRLVKGSHTHGYEPSHTLQCGYMLNGWRSTNVRMRNLLYGQSYLMEFSWKRLVCISRLKQIGLHESVETDWAAWVGWSTLGCMSRLKQIGLHGSVETVRAAWVGWNRLVCMSRLKQIGLHESVETDWAAWVGWNRLGCMSRLKQIGLHESVETDWAA
jgi:hypothetical protein